jgi:hypothetical protein
MPDAPTQLAATWNPDAALVPAELADALHTMRVILLARGYRDITKHGALKLGARVYHRGHQWPGASAGTGTVAAVMQRDPSPWAQAWGRPDVELIVWYDDGGGILDGKLHSLADYHLRVAEAVSVDA